MNKTIIIPAIADDGSLYPVEKMAAHVQGVLHLAISVFVFDGDRLLIQKRAAVKYHCAGQWANTCCSHPHWNETLEDCASRRLQEELGFSVPLIRRQTVEYAASVGEGLSEHERVTLFCAQVAADSIEINPDPSEVEAVRWIAPSQLRYELGACPDAFTPWFRIYLNRFPELKF
ncbi:isopentenyl-diphosphate delta-isomerase [Breoghania sp. JC706]|uniref:isopentenyl-diphosphate delta-isomerase n=1 Tax=Breoghania sp. JC706 TaxID=3117732 RepID=UPI00300BBF2B